MGCDIHGVVERRIRQAPLPDRWIGVRTLHGFHTNDTRYGFATPSSKERNYERFAALAGVRGSGPEARGLPPDASDTAIFLYEVEGDHTPSWLPLQEAAQIFLATDRFETKTTAESYPAYYYFGIDESDGDIADFRLVFWFDS